MHAIVNDAMLSALPGQHGGNGSMEVWKKICALMQVSCNRCVLMQVSCNRKHFDPVTVFLLYTCKAN